MSKRVLFAVTAILLMVSGCGGSNGGHSAGSSTPHPNPFAGEKAWVAYHTTHNDLESVGLVHPDGKENHQVTTDVLSQQQQLLPDWSPDGKRLVFATRGGDTNRSTSTNLPHTRPGSCLCAPFLAWAMTSRLTGLMARRLPSFGLSAHC